LQVEPLRGLVSLSRASQLNAGVRHTMEMRACPACSEELPSDAFRKGARSCVWCAWADPIKRAKARYRDKQKLPSGRLRITLPEFVAWYAAQEDRCAYCGITFAELRSLRIKRGGGYSVAWDIDRVDSSRPYEAGNLALSCFVCNMAKGDQLSPSEARLVGEAVREVWRARLRRGA
jgi:hypothetical protein